MASFTMVELFRLGGITMWPLTLFSIITVFLTLERAIFFIYHNLTMDDLTARVSQNIKDGDFAGAEKYLSGQVKRRMGARILLALLQHSKIEPGKTFSEHQAEKAAETESAKCLTSLENGLNFLTALGSISPLTGFLGTVTGMIGAFRSIAEAAEVNAQIVAGGIYEALITTVYGLVIAITAMIFHSLYTHLVDKFAASIELNCSRLIIEISEKAEDLRKK